MTATFIHPLTSFIEKTFVITEFELRKLRHDFTELITRALQPALWLLIFGQVFSRSGVMPTGNVPYLDFIAPGIRVRICEGLGFFAVELNSARYAENAAVISSDASRVTVRVVRTDEEIMIARSVLRSCPEVTAE